MKIFKKSDFLEEIKPISPSIERIYDTDNKYYLSKIYIFCFIAFGHKFKMTIPKGFIFDGASIPRFFWRIVGHPFSPRFLLPALIHDALFGKISDKVKIYKDGNLLKSEQANEFFDRKKTDIIFEELLELENNNWFTKRVMYRAVRTGGWAKFRKSRNEFYLES